MNKSNVADVAGVYLCNLNVQRARELERIVSAHDSRPVHILSLCDREVEV